MTAQIQMASGVTPAGTSAVFTTARSPSIQVVIGKNATMAMTAEIHRPLYSAPMMVPFGLILTNSVPMIEAMMEAAPMTRGNPSDTAMLSAPNARLPMSMAATVVTTYVSNRSAAMPAQSPTLSPTLSAMTAGLRGSSSGMPASTLPTRSAPTSAAFVKMPPPRRANTEMSEPPKPRPTSAENGAMPRNTRIDMTDTERMPRPITNMPVTVPRLERHAQGMTQPGACRFSRAHVRRNRDAHADEAGSSRGHAAHDEADGRPHAEAGNAQEPGHQKHDGHNDAHEWRPCGTGGPDTPWRLPVWPMQCPASFRCLPATC